MINKKYFLIFLLLTLFMLPNIHANLTDNLVAYYNFDETSGTTLNDIVGSTVSINQTGLIGKSYLFYNNNGNVFTCIRNYAWHTNRNIRLFNNEMI